jgi:Flp pilus assembly protein TadG
MLRDLVRNRKGATALVFALSAVPLILMGGAAVDYGRMMRAEAYMQQVGDAAALAAAASNSKVRSDLERIARNYVEANHDPYLVGDLRVSGVEITENDEVVVRTETELPATFMAIAGFDELGISTSSTAVRGYPGSVEIAMVLDNTWSMSDVDSKGVKKIDALKSSARLLVDELTKVKDADVQFGLVPYADYVNVGTSNRSQPWIDVAADYSVTSPRTCQTLTTRQQCTRTQVGPKKTCTRTVDGVPETYDCTQYQNNCQTVTVPPYESCSGGGTTNYRWYGCVASRKTGMLRITDASPSVPYPGMLATSQNCLNPIVPLTSNAATVRTAISNMIINIGSYKPNTYIPAGLVWGINVLSPSAPFTEGKAYDPSNRKPRKALVLMTDGVNTLRFQASDGRHVSLSSNAATATQQLRQTNEDTASLCSYAKSQNIEVFTIAFAVNDATAKTLLQNCATGSDYYFDASDSTTLTAAFSSIAYSLREIRLAK